MVGAQAERAVSLRVSTGCRATHRSRNIEAAPMWRQEIEEFRMSISDDDITSTNGPAGEGTADGGANTGGHDGGADGSAGEGTADGGANTGGHDGGADGSA